MEELFNNETIRAALVAAIAAIIGAGAYFIRRWINRKVATADKSTEFNAKIQEIETRRQENEVQIMAFITDLAQQAAQERQDMALERKANRDKDQAFLKTLEGFRKTEKELRDEIQQLKLDLNTLKENHKQELEAMTMKFNEELEGERDKRRDLEARLDIEIKAREDAETQRAQIEEKLNEVTQELVNPTEEKSA